MFVGTDRSIRALRAATDSDKNILLVARRDSDVADPGPDDLFKVGTVGTVLQFLSLPDGKVKALVEGGQRAKIERFVTDGDYLVAEVTEVDEPEPPGAVAEAALRSLLGQFERFASASKKVSKDVLASLASIDDPARLADAIAAQGPFKLDAQQEVLETFDLEPRVQRVVGLLNGEIDARQMDRRFAAKSRSKWRRASASTT